MNREFYPYLTVSRFIAALCVAGFHGAEAMAHVAPAIRTIFENGYIGVSFFFVLSGFLLGRLYRPEDVRYGAFMRARWTRIYPTYLFCLLIPILGQLVKVVQGPTTESILTLLLPIVMLQVWVPGYSLALLGPAWSLSCEMVFYALFPWLRRAVDQAKPATLGPAALCCVGLPILTTLLVRSSGHHRFDQLVVFLVYFPPMHFGSFALGVIAAKFRIQQRWLIPIFVAGMGLVLALMYSPLDVMLKYTSASALPMAAIVLSMSGFKAPATFPRILNWLLLMGDASYVFYLTHVVTFKFVAKLGLTMGPPLLMLQMIVALTVAVVIHLRIEKPLIKWVRNHRLGQSRAME